MEVTFMEKTTISTLATAKVMGPDLSDLANAVCPIYSNLRSAIKKADAIVTADSNLCYNGWYDISANQCAIYTNNDKGKPSIIVVNGYENSAVIVPFVHNDNIVYEVARIENNIPISFCADYDMSLDDEERERIWHMSYSTVINGETVYVSEVGTVRTKKEVNEILAKTQEGYYYDDDTDTEDDEEEYGEADNSLELSNVWTYCEEKRRGELEDYRTTSGNVYYGEDAAIIALAAYNKTTVDKINSLLEKGWKIHNLNKDSDDNRECNIQLCTSYTSDIVNELNCYYNFYIDVNGIRWEKSDDCYIVKELLSKLCND